MNTSEKPVADDTWDEHYQDERDAAFGERFERANCGFRAESGIARRTGLSLCASNDRFARRPFQRHLAGDLSRWRPRQCKSGEPETLATGDGVS